MALDAAQPFQQFPPRERYLSFIACQLREQRCWERVRVKHGSGSHRAIEKQMEGGVG